MTWEYRVIHEKVEVPGDGHGMPPEDSYGIVEVYYAKPGVTRVVTNPSDGPWYNAVCSLCGTVTENTFRATAYAIRDAHVCPDKVDAWSDPETTRPGGGSVEELVSDLVLMLRACWKPVLEKDALHGEAKPKCPPRWYVRHGSGGVTSPWGAVDGETRGAAVDAYVEAKGPFAPVIRFEVKPYDG